MACYNSWQRQYYNPLQQQYYPVQQYQMNAYQSMPYYSFQPYMNNLNLGASDICQSGNDIVNFLNKNINPFIKDIINKGLTNKKLDAKTGGLSFYGDTIFIRELKLDPVASVVCKNPITNKETSIKLLGTISFSMENVNIKLGMQLPIFQLIATGTVFLELWPDPLAIKNIELRNLSFQGIAYSKNMNDQSQINGAFQFISFLSPTILRVLNEFMKKALIPKVSLNISNNVNNNNLLGFVGEEKKTIQDITNKDKTNYDFITKFEGEDFYDSGLSNCNSACQKNNSCIDFDYQYRQGIPGSYTCNLYKIKTTPSPSPSPTPSPQKLHTQSDVSAFLIPQINALIKTDFVSKELSPISVNVGTEESYCVPPGQIVSRIGCVGPCSWYHNIKINDITGLEKIQLQSMNFSKPQQVSNTNNYDINFTITATIPTPTLRTSVNIQLCTPVATIAFRNDIKPNFNNQVTLSGKIRAVYNPNTDTTRYCIKNISIDSISINMRFDWQSFFQNKGNFLQQIFRLASSAVLDFVTKAVLMIVPQVKDLIVNLILKVLQNFLRGRPECIDLFGKPSW
jgi:hypothetical protein